jgi:hypothetical protein
MTRRRRTFLVITHLERESEATFKYMAKHIEMVPSTPIESSKGGIVSYRRKPSRLCGVEAPLTLHYVPEYDRIKAEIFVTPHKSIIVSLSL